MVVTRVMITQVTQQAELVHLVRMLEALVMNLVQLKCVARWVEEVLAVGQVMITQVTQQAGHAHLVQM